MRLRVLIVTGALLVAFRLFANTMSIGLSGG